jgi:Secretion system C-terminal sorting domain
MTLEIHKLEKIKFCIMKKTIVSLLLILTGSILITVTVSAQNNPLIGKWNWIDGPASVLWYDFINDSACTIFAPPDTITSSYKFDTIASPHRITWYYNDLKMNLGIWSISGDTLRVKATSGDTITFPSSFGWEPNYPWVASHYVKQASAGINEKRNILFNLYPNPASDIVTLNINKTNNENLEINIYDILGDLVLSESLKQNQQKINIGDLNNGIYIVEINSNEWSGKQKLIIQR